MSIAKDSARGAIWKKLLLLFSGILILFASINGVWYFGYQKRYDDIAAHLSEYFKMDIEEPEMRRYGKQVGEYQIGVKKPAYLGTGGFVSVGPGDTTVEIDGEGKMYAETYTGIYIYPKWFSGYELVFEIDNPETGEWFMIDMTPDLDLPKEYEENLDPEVAGRFRQIIAEHREEIEAMIDAAEKTLDIKIIDT